MIGYQRNKKKKATFHVNNFKCKAKDIESYDSLLLSYFYWWLVVSFGFVPQNYEDTQALPAVIEKSELFEQMVGRLKHLAHALTPTCAPLMQSHPSHLVKLSFPIFNLF